MFEHESCKKKKKKTIALKNVGYSFLAKYCEILFHFEYESKLLFQMMLYELTVDNNAISRSINHILQGG